MCSCSVWCAGASAVGRATRARPGQREQHGSVLSVCTCHRAQALLVPSVSPPHCRSVPPGMISNAARSVRHLWLSPVGAIMKMRKCVKPRSDCERLTSWWIFLNVVLKGKASPPYSYISLSTSEKITHEDCYSHEKYEQCCTYLESRLCSTASAAVATLAHLHLTKLVTVWSWEQSRAQLEGPYFSHLYNFNSFTALLAPYQQTLSKSVSV